MPNKVAIVMGNYEPNLIGACPRCQEIKITWRRLIGIKNSIQTPRFIQ